MHKFRQGDRVICIAARPGLVSLDQQYEIQEVYLPHNFFRLKDVPGWWTSNCFSLLPPTPPPVYKYYYSWPTANSVNRSMDYDSLESIKACVSFKRNLFQATSPVTIHRSEQIGEADLGITLNIKE